MGRTHPDGVAWCLCRAPRLSSLSISSFCSALGKQSPERRRRRRRRLRRKRRRRRQEMQAGSGAHLISKGNQRRPSLQPPPPPPTPLPKLHQPSPGRCRTRPRAQCTRCSGRARGSRAQRRSSFRCRSLTICIPVATAKAKRSLPGYLEGEGRAERGLVGERKARSLGSDKGDVKREGHSPARWWPRARGAWRTAGATARPRLPLRGPEEEWEEKGTGGLERAASSRPKRKAGGRHEHQCGEMMGD